MNRCLARLDRDTALGLVDTAAALPLQEVAAALPDQITVVTWPAVADPRIPADALTGLRRSLLALAADHGYPDTAVRLPEFDARATVLLHTGLRISAHEAGQDEAWTWLTCCWLLDVALWRFGRQADRRRFLGDVNRNTFRRLWWRREVLGADVDLAQFGEDELVQIMERPTLSSDTWLAQTIAREFLEGTRRHPGIQRMQLMRETTKRLLRRTPFIDHAALSGIELTEQIRGAVDSAANALNGLAPPAPAADVPPPGLRPSVGVRQLPRHPVGDVADLPEDEPRPDTTEAGTARHGPTDQAGPSTTDARSVVSWSQAAAVAVDLAARTGQVTNLSLRTLLGIDTQQCRLILQGQVAAGNLVRRGEKRGTYYTLAATPAPAASVTGADQPRTVATAPRNSETVLRQALDRAQAVDPAGEPEDDTRAGDDRQDAPTVRDLFDSGLVPADVVLTATFRGRTWRARMLPDGQVLPLEGGYPRSLDLLTNQIGGNRQSTMRMWHLEKRGGFTVSLQELGDELTGRPGRAGDDRL